MTFGTVNNGIDNTKVMIANGAAKNHGLPAAAQCLVKLWSELTDRAKDTFYFTVRLWEVGIFR